MAVHVIDHVSDVLKANPLGDPHRRQLHVVVPDDLEDGASLVCIWWLAGYAGVSRGMLSHDPWQEGIEERVARLRAEGRIGKTIIVLPDTFTKLGGCQYLSSSALGDYEAYLFEELYPLVASRYDISAHAIAGKSSGGFGAIVHAMRHPDLFSAVACHSGDMGFDMALVPDIPKLMNAVRDYGSVEALVDAFDAAVKKKDGRWFGPISMLALCAAYSPDPSAPLGIGLPFDVETGHLDQQVLDRWRAWDPVHMLDQPECQAALERMKLTFIDCGKRDEHHLHWGARQFSTKLKQLGIDHQHEEFDGGHRGTSHRLDVSFPLLYDALTSS